MRADDFPEPIKRQLRERVAFICSYPECRDLTCGPSRSSASSLITGEACHIHAASPGGARYDKEQTSQQRKSFENGIWLCRKHSKVIDTDFREYPASTLIEWKKETEAWVEGNSHAPKLPLVTLKTGDGIPSCLFPNNELKGDDYVKYRSIKFQITNPNRVYLRDIAVRFQFPDPIVKLEIRKSHHTETSFEPENFDSFGIASEGGYIQKGEALPAMNWILKVEKLSPKGKITILALTEETEISKISKKIKAEDEISDKGSLFYYAQGEYLFEYRKEWLTQAWLTPFLYDINSREIKSLSTEYYIGQQLDIVQSSFGPWTISEGGQITTSFEPDI